MYGFHTDAFYAPTPSSLEHDVLPHYIRHLQLKAVPIKASFIDIGIPKDYHAFCAYDRNIISTSDPKDGTTTSKDWAEDP
jgi:NDP-sugar pyrophosphorylase family protein